MPSVDLYILMSVGGHFVMSINVYMGERGRQIVPYMGICRREIVPSTDLY